MPSARQDALNAIKTGDVIYGMSGAGNDKLLLVYEVSDSRIFARHITSQTSGEFDRTSGRTLQVPSGRSCTIVSTAVLPEDRYQTAIGLDQKFRTGKKYPDFVLSKAEIELILTYADFFNAHLLPNE